MLQASAKNVVRMAIALGAFALAALVAAPDSTRSAAGDFGGAGTPAPTPVPTPARIDALAPAPNATPAPKSDVDFDPNGKLAAPTAAPKPSYDGRDDLSPAIFGGSGKKRAPVYANLEASLENAAVLGAKKEIGGAADADMTADAVADAVSKTPLNDGADAVAVSVYAASDISDARRFLENRGVRVDYSGETWLEAYVPARLLGALSQRADVIRVEPIIPPVVDRMPAQSAPPDPCAATDLGTLSTTGGAGSVSRSGSWDSTCESSTRTGSYSRFYTFAIANDSVFEYVRADTTGADPVAPFAYLRSGTATSGDAIAEYLETGTDRRIGNVALDAGTYTVEATTLRAGDSGAFTLNMKFAEPTICAADTTIGAITTAATIAKTGTWTNACDSGGHKGSAKHYEFSVSQATTLTINLTTDTDADPVLYLRSGQDTFGLDYIARDDDGGGGTSARIIRALASGTYTIEAAASESVNGKAFALTLTSELVSICRETLDIATSPATETASWASGCDSATNPRSFARFYTFTLSARSEVTIELTTPDAAAADEDSPIVPKVDAHLYLRSAQKTDGAVVAESDDRSEIPLRTDPRIERTLDAGTMDAGEYTVEATTHIPKTAGAFTLTVTHAAERSDCAPTALRLRADGARNADRLRARADRERRELAHELRLRRQDRQPVRLLRLHAVQAGGCGAKPDIVGDGGGPVSVSAERLAELRNAYRIGRRRRSGQRRVHPALA